MDSATAAAPGRVGNRLLLPGSDLGLIPYLMAGHPDRETSLRTGRRLLDLGVTALELGVPCAHPRLDGPVIAGAGQRALAAGATVTGTLELAAELSRDADAPLILMTYLAPLLAHGPERFAEGAARAGVAGVIVPDLDPAWGEPIAAGLRGCGLHTIFVVGPATPEQQVADACEASTGFVYCALAGRTGPRAALPTGLAGLVGRVRRHTPLPVVAGFGISRPEHVAGIRGHADAVVVGSALVAALDAGRDITPLVEDLLGACR